MKIKTAVCYSFSLGAQDPMAYLRLIAPFRQAGIHIINGIENGQPVCELVHSGDIVVIQRDFPKNFDDYQKIVEIARRERKPLIFDLDDLLFLLPENHPDRLTQYYASSLLPMFQALLDADLVTVPTLKLRDELASYNDNVVVLPNYFDESLNRLKSPVLKDSPREILTIGFMGGNSHKPDLDYVTPVLLDLLKRYPQKICFYFWGIQPPDELGSLPQVNWSPHHSDSYKDFSAFFQTQSADIFIAPLVDNTFNRCKSPLKFYEYTALGAPGVFSRLEPYTDVVIHGHNGLLATSLDEWMDCLIQLIENSELRFQLATNAQTTIRANWLLSQNAFRWQEAFHNLGDVHSHKRPNNFINIIQSLNAQIQTLTSPTAKKEQTPHTSAQIAEMSAELAAIHGSRAWQLTQRLQHAKTRLIPHGSRRERFARQILQTTRDVRRSVRYVFKNYGFLSAVQEAWGNLNRTSLQENSDPSWTIFDAEVKANEINDFSEHLAKVRLGLFLSENSTLLLPAYEKPLVSIILLFYNRAEMSLQCLEALASGAAGIPFEVIIVDNASTDATSKILDHIQNARIIRNSVNRGFGGGCNQAVEIASGKYLLFLNNDAQLLPGSLKSLIDTLESNSLIGAVGGKLIYPDGNLQEAGSIIWRDGTCAGYGRNANPLSPEFCYVRDVDFASAALLLTHRELFLKLGKFDPRFAPAYYEDVDYCVTLWNAGYRVVFQPFAMAIHHEYGSSGKEKATELQTKNQEKFREKWHNYLKSKKDASSDNMLISREHFAETRRILFIDDLIPDYRLGAGFPRTYKILEILISMGYRLTFMPFLVFTFDPMILHSLQIKGIEVLYNLPGRTFDLEKFLKSRPDYYDIVFISRPHNMQKAFKAIRQYLPNATLIYDAEALFSLRDIAFRELNGEQIPDAEKEAMIKSEVALTQSADIVVTVSESEKKLLSKYGAPSVHILGHAVHLLPTPASFDERKDILFVGGILDYSAPNEDAVHYFIRDIFPLIRKQIDCNFYVVGTNKVKQIWKMASKDIHIIGKVDDLTPYYNQCRLFVVPTRYAAGIPLKLVEATAHGLPAVTTPLIARQLGWEEDRDLLVGHTPNDFAEKVISLYTNSQLFQFLRQNALEHIRQEYSEEVFKHNLTEIINSSSIPANEPPKQLQ